MTPWAKEFVRVPEDEWVHQPLEELAKKYDTVEQHGWYDNLEPTIDELLARVADGGLCIDYSGGTGILVGRLLRRAPANRRRFIIVDASPKFLRLALEKLGNDERVAFRWLRYLKHEKRLQLLDEVLDRSLLSPGVDCIVSTNAIHLYYDLGDTLASWARTLRSGGLALVQSGNIQNPSAPPGSWIIDDTVERVQEHAQALVRSEPRFAPFRSSLDDPQRLATYAALRRKVFVPVRALSYYVTAFAAAGLEVEKVDTRAFAAKVDEWFEFLSAYDEGVLGWAGGAEKLEGKPTPPALVTLRRELLRAGLDRLFDGRSSFTAVWTYLNCRK
jgi:SAM-dependent methyltransferase